MGPDETHFLVTRNTLYKKIENFNEFISKLPKTELNSLFVQHARDILDKAVSRINDSDVARAPFLRDGHHRSSWLYLERLNEQLETFKLFQSSIRNQRWKLLNYLISHATKAMELKSKPLCLFGSNYFSTGSFIYRRWGLQVSQPFYQVSVDMNDPMMYWILVAHELGHCKISEVGLSQLENKLRENKLTDETYSARIKEVISDGLATCIYGFAYPASFKARLSWAAGSESEYYPRFNFRLMTMLELLQNLGFDIPKYYRVFIKPDERDAKKEEICFLVKDLINFCKNTVPKPFFMELDDIENFSYDIAKIDELSDSAIALVYNVAWLCLLQNKGDFSELTENVSTALKRLAARS